jgi:hypothetical protein
MGTLRTFSNRPFNGGALVIEVYVNSMHKCFLQIATEASRTFLLLMLFILQIISIVF